MILEFYEAGNTIYDDITLNVSRGVRNFDKQLASEIISLLEKLIGMINKLPKYMQFLAYGMYRTIEQLQTEIQQNGGDFIYMEEERMQPLSEYILGDIHSAHDNYAVWDDLHAVLKTGVFNPRNFDGVRNASARLSTLRVKHRLNIDRCFLNIDIPKIIDFVANHRRMYTRLQPDFRPMVSEYLCSILAVGASVKECDCCGKLFVTFTGHDSVYCSRTIHEDGKNCYQKGSVSKYRKKLEKDEGLKIYTRYYKKMFARIRYGYLTKEQFEQWKNDAKVLLKQYEKSEYSVFQLEEALSQLCKKFPIEDTL